MPDIGEKTIDEIAERVKLHLDKNQKAINVAYLATEGTFKISFGVTIRPAGVNGNEVIVKTAFQPTEKIEEQSIFIIDENQKQLPGME